MGDAVRWAGRVAFVVAVAVSMGWAIALVVYMLARLSGSSVPSDAATLLSTVGGVLAGAVATYLGNSSERRDASSRTRSGDDTPGPASSSVHDMTGHAVASDGTSKTNEG